MTYLHLKMAQKSGKLCQVAQLEMSQPIRRENGDVMETKTRLDDIIRGIKVLDTVVFLIPSPAVKEATTKIPKPHHMASGGWQDTVFSHHQCPDGTYELPDYSNECNNEM